LEEERVIYQKLTIPVETGSALIHLDVMTSPEIINLARCLLKLGKKKCYFQESYKNLDESMHIHSMHGRSRRNTYQVLVLGCLEPHVL
jgi:hypothetical protein